MGNMKEYLAAFNLLTDEEIENFAQMMRPRRLKKGDFFVKEGTTCNEIAFVVSGSLRSFYYSTNSDEITYCLTFQNSFMTAYSSLILGTKTNENIEALTDVELLVLTKDQLHQLESSSVNSLRFSKLMAEREYIKLEQRIFLLQKETAETRYFDLVKNHPEYIQSVPLIHLASYLGITQRHLSRIRKTKVA